MTAAPLLIAHTSWYDHYDGSDDGFYPGNFKGARAVGYGLEIQNFLEFRGQVYGYVELQRNRINIDKLGAKHGDDSVSGVTVVWTAPSPHHGGRVVVGWYRNATVYREPQAPTGQLAQQRTSHGVRLPYQIQAAAADAVRLPTQQRAMVFPRRSGKTSDLPGQRSIFYVNTEGREKAIGRALRSAIISSKPVPFKRTRGKGSQSRGAANPKVEKSAIEIVKAYYDDLGYTLTDRQAHGCGYDLLFTLADVTLCVEVKGLSGTQIQVDFTRLEYECIRDHERGRFADGEYRIAVVTQALHAAGGARLHQFAWLPYGPKRKRCWLEMGGGSSPKIMRVKSTTAGTGRSP